jgi:hypothetical protein
LPTTLTPAMEARILEWSVKRKPRDGSTHWSTRKLAAHLGVSRMMVARVWRKQEVFRPDDVLAGIRTVLERSVIGFDAVKRLVLCRIERRPPRRDLAAGRLLRQLRGWFLWTTRSARSERFPLT